jgi:uncharacterized protein (TIGR03083 family)
MAEGGGGQAAVRAVGAAVRREAAAIAATMRDKDERGWDAPSWCEGWSLLDVVSHLTEGTERFYLQTRAALDGQPVPEFSMDERNARRAKVKALPKAAMLAELERRNETFFADLEGRDDAALARPAVPLGPGRTLSGAQVAELRLNELLLHHWDLLAPSQPDATLSPAGAGLVADYVLGNAARMAKPDALQGLDATFLCDTSGSGGGPVTITCRDGKADVARGAAGRADATLRLPAEALLRFLWGRVDVERALADGILQVDGDREKVLALGRAFGNR